MLIYKSTAMPYPSRYIGLDSALLIIFLGTDFLRLYLGSRGNKTHQKLPLAVCIFLCGGLIGLHTYFLLYQTFMYDFIRCMF